MAWRPNIEYEYAAGRHPSDFRQPLLFTQIDLHDLINDFTEPYFLFITQQITTFLSMKNYTENDLPSYRKIRKISTHVPKRNHTIS
jgi:hypothetical protein